MRQQTPEGIKSRRDAIAQDIAVERGAAVIEALFYVAAIRSLQPEGRNGAGASVTCAKAALNDTNASNTGIGLGGEAISQQAAHLVPGQIYVNNVLVWQLATSAVLPAGSRVDVQRLSVNTQMCFARTNVLPEILNRADSQGEGSSESQPRLKQLFGEAARHIWKHSTVDASQPLLVDQPVVVAALQQRFAACSAVYLQASAVKMAAAARLGTDPKAAERRDESKVLEVYANSYRVANPMRIVDSKLPWLRQQFL